MVGRVVHFVVTQITGNLVSLSLIKSETCVDVDAFFFFLEQIEFFLQPKCISFCGICDIHYMPLHLYVAIPK